MTARRNTYLRWIFLLLFLLPFALRAQQQTPPTTRQQNTAAPQNASEKTIVNYYGDLMARRGAGDTILYLNDHVIFHHNGTFIQCDSARRYDQYRMECFGNVVINKDSTYIYGDQASYDGHTDIAKVYSPLLKLVNGDATMWVNNYMEFNTRTNIGEYNEGAFIVQRDNHMESDHGLYNGDSATITFIGHVAMRNDNYQMRTDSISYDLDNEIVTFLTKTYIWDKERDFLTADRGNYIRATETYHFTRNAYAMTQDQEFWADTMDYASAIRQVTMRSNIQILDTAQRAIGLGDYGFYNDSLKNGMLTRQPAVILYDTVASEQPASINTAMQAPATPVEPDSTFARADTILFNSYPPGKSKPKPAIDSALAPTHSVDSIAMPGDSTLKPAADSLPAITSAAGDSITHRPTIGVEEPPAPTAPDSLLSIPLPDSTATTDKDTLEHVIRGRRNVKMWRKDIQGVADSLTAYTVDSMVTLFGRPLIWSGTSQLTSDRIDIYSRNEELDYAEFIGSPFITQQVEQADTLFNQAQGRLLQAWFTDNSISRAIMTGNVINYYYMGDDSLPPDKFAVISCATLTIDFEDQEPVHLNWGGQSNWYIDPIDKIPAEQSQRLPNFSWEPERKPGDRYDITRRNVRPTLRSIAEGYARPVFSIEESINATRDALLQGGSWHDRNEPLDDSRVEKIHSNDLLY